jgi:hypothetical protein
MVDSPCKTDPGRIHSDTEEIEKKGGVMSTDTSVFAWLFMLSAVVTTMIGLLLWRHVLTEENIYTVTSFDIRAEQGTSSDCARHQCVTDQCSCISPHGIETSCVLACVEYKDKYRAVGTCRLISTLYNTTLASTQTTEYLYETPECALSHQFPPNIMTSGGCFSVRTSAVECGHCAIDELQRGMLMTESFQDKRHRLIVSTAVFGSISTVFLVVVLSIVSVQYTKSRSM